MRVNVGQPNPLRWKNSGAVWRRYAEWTPGQWNDEKKFWFGLVRIGSGWFGLVLFGAGHGQCTEAPSTKNATSEKPQTSILQCSDDLAAKERIELQRSKFSPPAVLAA
jgi:hypothetical protein